MRRMRSSSCAKRDTVCEVQPCYASQGTLARESHNLGSDQNKPTGLNLSMLSSPTMLTVPDQTTAQQMLVQHTDVWSLLLV